MIKIWGAIGVDITLLDVITQVKGECVEKGEMLDVMINSVGGYAEEGLAIYEYLRNRGNIHTICTGSCCSIASVIFMAGDRRTAMCDLMIHNPFVTVSADSKASSDELRNGADYLDELRGRITDVYSKVSEIDKSTLERLMNVETFISPDTAVNIGLATEKGIIKAVAMLTQPIIKKEIIKKNENKIKKSKKMKIKDYLKKALNVLEYKNMDFSSADGTVFSVSIEEGEPEVGDVASPDGSYLMEDGSTIVVTDGMISEIIPAEEQEPEPTEPVASAELLKRISLLEASIRNMSVKMMEYQKPIDDYLSAKNSKSNGFVPSPRGFVPSSVPAPTATPADKRAEYFADRKKALKTKK